MRRAAFAAAAAAVAATAAGAAGASAAPIPPAPLADDGDGAISSTLQVLLSEGQRKSDAERSLNTCFSEAYAAMAKGSSRRRGAGAVRFCVP